jgi:hypothetical protein
MAIEVFGNWAGLKRVLNLATRSGRKMESARDLEATAVAVRCGWRSFVARLSHDWAENDIVSTV